MLEQIFKKGSMFTAPTKGNYYTTDDDEVKHNLLRKDKSLRAERASNNSGNRDPS